VFLLDPAALILTHDHSGAKISKGVRFSVSVSAGSRLK
jgi:hypothetical protein